jgi:hypothetical protein
MGEIQVGVSARSIPDVSNTAGGGRGTGVQHSLVADVRMWSKTGALVHWQTSWAGGGAGLQVGRGAPPTQEP